MSIYHLGVVPKTKDPRKSCIIGQVSIKCSAESQRAIFPFSSHMLVSSHDKLNDLKEMADQSGTWNLTALLHSACGHRSSFVYLAITTWSTAVMPYATVVGPGGGAGRLWRVVPWLTRPLDSNLLMLPWTSISHCNTFTFTSSSLAIPFSDQIYVLICTLIHSF